MTEEKNKNLNKVKQIIETATGKTAKITAVPSELINFTGKTQKAVFLAQLIYWSDKSTRTDKFVYKTANDWKKEIGLGRSQLESFTAEFKKLGFLETKVKRAEGNPTVHYKLDLEKFLISFSEFLTTRYTQNSQNQMLENDESLTENTTENTTQSITREREESHSFYTDSEGNKKEFERKQDFDFQDNTSSLRDSFDNSISSADADDVILGEVVSNDQAFIAQDSQIADFLPVNFQLTEEMRNWAVEKSKKGVDIDASTSKFIVYYEGRKDKNWTKKWKIWILNEKPETPSIAIRKSANEERVDRIKHLTTTDLFADITD